MPPSTSQSPTRRHPVDHPPPYDEGPLRALPTDANFTHNSRTTSFERLLIRVSEQSPLISPRTSADTITGNGMRDFDAPSMDVGGEDDGQETKSTLYLVLLVLSIGGLQIAWCVELSNGTPYLLSLGLSKSLMALVWIAGPLSGTLVQPYVGIRSDNCRISWGKRKPFMIGGALATIVSLLALAWTREIVQGFLGLFGVDPTSDGTKNMVIIVAVLFVYVLDFAINTVQAAIRAFIVDGAPTHQQESANAWAGRITGVGNILGYLSGYVRLPAILPFFGNTQFQVLCVIACISLGVTVAISSLTIKERDPRRERPAEAAIGGVVAFFKQVFTSVRRLPPQIRAVCEVQFFAWIGWFPFLFYITTYVGQLYVNPIFADHPNMTSDEIDEVWEEATRIGTFSLLVFAFTSFAANILLPFFVAPSYAPTASVSDPPEKPNRILQKLVIPWLTLRRAWLLSLVLYAVTLFCTFFVSTPTGGTVLVGIVGIAWALTLWAPFALISAEISKRDALRRTKCFQSGQRTRSFGHQSSHRPSTPLSSLSHPTSPMYFNRTDAEEETDQAGIILGIHNVAIAAPQVIATLGSSVIFRSLQKPRGAADDDSVGWVLRAGAVATCVAVWFCTRVKEERDENDRDGMRSFGDEERRGSAAGLVTGMAH
ncbi:MAG: hypothetical protein M1817_006394 [Caeruleum heppii]|nr:MAG: hypothetical protein M1817_006394 [Caeruleum heppii]